jgi:AraC family transcriptional regulator, regulatory protein of adaptative response / DNA-3-methyladenine glycosylase II
VQVRRLAEFGQPGLPQRRVILACPKTASLTHRACDDGRVIDDFERCYRLIQSRDRRYDGLFYSAVTTTRVYCRPSCPARMPKRENTRFYATAAAAQAAGFRACKRCRPDAAPGAPTWNWRADTATRAVRLIAEGVVDRDGVAGLARRLGFSERHLRRLLVDEVGTGPVALARARRAQTARLLIESTALTFSEVAVAAGFRSVRQFNEAIRAVFAFTPSELRRRSAGGVRTFGTVEFRLSVREPFDGNALLRFLGERAVPGVEEVDGRTYRRALGLAYGGGVVELTPERDAVGSVLHLDDLRDLGSAIARCRRLLDLDADPFAINDTLGDEIVIGPLVRAHPGLRLPGCVDEEELVLRTCLGERLTSPPAGKTAGSLIATLGTPLSQPVGRVTHLFPTAAALATADPSALPVPELARKKLHRWARLLADGLLLEDSLLPRLDADYRGGAAAYVAMRGLHDPDVIPLRDAGLERAVRTLGRRTLASVQERWRPWRGYAAVQLWHVNAGSSR